MELNPKDADAFYTRGSVYEKMGRLEESIADFTQALRLDPDHFNAAYARGACENRLGNYAKAIEDYSMALEKDQRGIMSPRHLPLSSVNYILDSHSQYAAIPHANLVMFRLLNASYSNSVRSEATMNPSRKKLPPEEDLDASAAESQGSRSCSEHKEQKESPATVHRVNVSYGETKPLLAVTARKPFAALAEAATKARKMSAKTVKSTPTKAGTGKKPTMKEQAECFHSLGYEARQKGEFEKAVTYYTKAIELNPRHLKAYFNRGFAYDRLQQYEKAIEDYSRALEVDSKNSFAYYNRGISLDKMERFDDAIYNFSMAITLLPTNADFYHNRGFAFRKKQEIEKAVSDYSKAIELNPKHFKVLPLFVIVSHRHITTGPRAGTRWASWRTPRRTTSNRWNCSHPTSTSCTTWARCRRSWAGPSSMIRSTFSQRHLRWTLSSPTGTTAVGWHWTSCCRTTPRSKTSVGQSRSTPGTPRTGTTAPAVSAT